jgi:hypothetical protein
MFCLAALLPISGYAKAMQEGLCFSDKKRIIE